MSPLKHELSNMANKVRKKDEAKKENHLCDEGFAAWSFTVAAE